MQQPNPPPLDDLGDLTPAPMAQLTPSPEVDLEMPSSDLDPEAAKDLVFDEVPEVHKRTIANDARRYFTSDAAFLVAVATLTRQYQIDFNELNPREPNYERLCVRAQITIGVLGDLVGQLGAIAQYNAVDQARVRATARGIV